MSKIQPAPTQIIEIENVQWCIIKPIANLYICGVCPFPETRQFIQLIYFFKMSDMLCQRRKVLCKIYILSTKLRLEYSIRRHIP